ncbi:hypothetical protein OS189_12035 [Sulfitobacter sp. F26169L]|uniref:hypothetical protein n=1 Tax=Sulfitobacter sp. F26169L TaxID=2996015 RepID=UPI002260A4C7|nr:hypothetical protein [Sulfitobacter sp. F26169L]MCX7567072.1 hypothetical protein [Sulfitobacter sp. F26169L]
MTFSETYREERQITRRSRARTARFLGRVIGFGLTACLVVALRTDPQLRAMVENAALAVMGTSDTGQTANPGEVQAEAIRSLGYAPDSGEAHAIQTFGPSDASAKNASPRVGQMPVSRVKINRAGSD